jgi:hypothetical protein
MSRAELALALETEDQLDADEVERLLGLADERGTSDPDVSLDELLATNRAGVNESTLSATEIIRQYGDS